MYIDVGNGNRVPMCFECADDEPCAVRRGRAKTVSGPRQVDPAPAMAPKVEEKQMTVRSGRRPGQRIADEIKDQIRAASTDVTNVELARKFGISDVSVCVIRKQSAVSRKRGRRPTTATAVAERQRGNSIALAANVRPIEVDPQRPGSADALIRALDGQGKSGGGDRFTVSLELTRADVHRMVDSMTTEQLAELVQRRIGAAK